MQDCKRYRNIHDTDQKVLQEEHIQKNHNLEESIKKINPEALQGDATSYLGNRYGKFPDYFKDLEKSPKNIGITRQQRLCRFLWTRLDSKDPLDF